MSISSMLDSGNDNHHPHHHPHHQSPRSGPPVLPPSMTSHAAMSPPSQVARPTLPGYPYNRSQTPDRLEYGFMAGNRHRSASGTSMPLDRAPYTTHERYPNPGLQQSYQVSPFGAPTREDSDNSRRASINSLLQRPNSQPQSLPQPQSSRVFDPAPVRNNWYADPPQPVPDPPRSNGYSGAYDTKPPGFRYMQRNSPATQQSSLHHPISQSESPDIRRSYLNHSSTPNKGALAGILNGPTSQPSDSFASHSMLRQDSTQSQNERSDNRFRHFSPFGLRTEDRKNSDDPTHKTILGLGLENRRRYSPVPQAVQGAQAQTPTPVPDKDHRVFSGLGGGISTTPQPTSSPFKQNAESLKMNRTASHPGKRSRKYDEFESTEPKKRKYQNSYKADLEELQRVPTTTRKYSPPIFKPKKTVKLNTITTQVLRKPRRHLGAFRYDADILADLESDTLQIKPRLIPSFSSSDVNCTYTFYVSKSWINTRELQLITSSRHLWGTGIYTDDTDPITAAMHMGFLKPSFSSIDETLLSRIVHDQNPRVDLGKELKPPSKPLDITTAKDLKITCVVMPPLEDYESTARFGVKSRAWPEGGSGHDGLSFSVLKVEVGDVGPLERKMGRTGKSKKEWLRGQLWVRERALQQQKVI